MNENILKGKWKELQGQVKRTWGKLTDDDLTKIEGSVETLKGRLQQRYGYNEEAANKEIEKFKKENDL